MFALLSQTASLAWPYVSRMETGAIPKDILGELAIGTRPTGRPLLRFKDVCQRDMKAGNVNPAGWEGVSAHQSQWRLAFKAGIQACEERRAEQRDEKRGCWRLRAASYPYPPSQARNSSATTARTACRCRIGLHSQRKRSNSITHWLNLGADSIVSRDRWMPTTSTNLKGQC